MVWAKWLCGRCWHTAVTVFQRWTEMVYIENIANLVSVRQMKISFCNFTYVHMTLTKPVTCNFSALQTGQPCFRCLFKKTEQSVMLNDPDVKNQIHLFQCHAYFPADCMDMFLTYTFVTTIHQPIRFTDVGYCTIMFRNILTTLAFFIENKCCVNISMCVPLYISIPAFGRDNSFPQMLVHCLWLHVGCV